MSKPGVVIIGSDGQLGTDLCKTIPEKYLLHKFNNIDIGNMKDLEKMIELIKPKFIVNTAAYHDLSRCEKNPELAAEINVNGVMNLITLCKKYNVTLIQISTDYVFDGKKGEPYQEDDIPNPLSVYGATKHAAEVAIEGILDEYYIVRTSALFGNSPCLGKGRTNFPMTILDKAERGESIKVVDNIFISITYTKHLSEKIYELIETKNYGIYHITNSGYCSWWAFAVVLCALALPGKMINLIPVKSDDDKLRPKFSVLDCNGIKDIGLKPLPFWTEGVSEYLKERRGIYG